MTESKKDRDTYTGEWWFPGNPDLKYHGILELYADNTGALTLHYSKGMRVKFKLETTIFGLMSGSRNASLIRCTKHSEKPTHLGHGAVTYDVNFVIDGAKVESLDEKIFRSMTVSFANIKPWYNEENFEDSERGYNEYEIIYRSPDNITYSLDENVSLTIIADLKTTPIINYHDEPIILREGVWFVFDSKVPLSYHDMYSYVSCLCHFIAIASKSHVSPVSLSITIEDDECATVISSELNKVVKTSNQFMNLYFTFTDIAEDTKEVFTAWFSRRNTLRPAREFYYFAKYSKSKTIESQLLFLVQAIESLFSATRNCSYVDQSMFIKDILPLLRDAIPSDLDKDFREAATGKLNYLNEYSLSKKLKTLFSEYSAYFDKVLPDWNKLRKKIVQTRNGLTHPKESLTNHWDMMFYSEILQQLLELCFISEMGFSPTEVDKMAFRGNSLGTIIRKDKN